MICKNMRSPVQANRKQINRKAQVKDQQTKTKHETADECNKVLPIERFEGNSEVIVVCTGGTHSERFARLHENTTVVNLRRCTVILANENLYMFSWHALMRMEFFFAQSTTCSGMSAASTSSVHKISEHQTVSTHTPCLFSPAVA